MIDRFLDRAFKPIVFLASGIFLLQALYSAVNQVVYLVIGAKQSSVVGYILLSAVQMWIISAFLVAIALGGWFFLKSRK